MRILVSGGAGFIGSHFVHRLRRAGEDVVVLDKLTYSGNRANLPEDVEFHEGDIAVPDDVAQAARGCDAIVNFAAETHVDRSILTAEDFGRTEFRGTQVLLEHIREAGIRLVQVSTDEVYGDLEAGGSSTGDRSAPSFESLQRGEGGRRPAHPGVHADVRRQRIDHARLEHLRAEPVSGEVHPTLRHERARRPGAAAVRRRQAGARLALRRGSLLRHRARAARGRAGRDLQRRRRRRGREHHGGRADRRADRHRPRAPPPRRRPPRTRPALLARHGEAARGSAGRRRRRSRAGWQRPCPGIATTATGGSGSSRANTASTTSGSTPTGSQTRRQPEQLARLLERVLDLATARLDRT